MCNKCKKNTYEIFYFLFLLHAKSLKPGVYFIITARIIFGLATFPVLISHR